MVAQEIKVVELDLLEKLHAMELSSSNQGADWVADTCRRARESLVRSLNEPARKLVDGHLTQLDELNEKIHLLEGMLQTYVERFGEIDEAADDG